MSWRSVPRIGLLVLDGFLAVSAIAGAFLVVPTMPMEWLKAGPFTDWTIPAIALGFVGFLATAAFLAVLRRRWLGAVASVVVGVGIIVFELVEIGVVGWTLSDPGPSYFPSWLQLIYLIVGSVQLLLGIRLWLATRDAAPVLPIIHPAAA